MRPIADLPNRATSDFDLVVGELVPPGTAPAAMDPQVGAVRVALGGQLAARADRAELEAAIAAAIEEHRSLAAKAPTDTPNDPAWISFAGIDLDPAAHSALLKRVADLVRKPPA
jgi:hypothetical protein